MASGKTLLIVYMLFISFGAVFSGLLVLSSRDQAVLAGQFSLTGGGRRGMVSAGQRPFLATTSFCFPEDEALCTMWGAPVLCAQEQFCENLRAALFWLM
jgi:hypothetical protein